MALMKKPKRVIEVGGKKIVLEPKPAKTPFSLFKKKPAPSVQKTPSMSEPSAPAAAAQQPAAPKKEEPTAQAVASQLLAKKSPFAFLKPKPKGQAKAKAKMEVPQLEIPGAAPSGKEKSMSEGASTAEEKAVAGIVAGKHSKYIEKVISKQKGLSTALSNQGVNQSVYDFVKRMMIASAALSIVLAVTLFILFSIILPPSATGQPSTIEALILALVLGIAIYQFAFRSFIQYPFRKSANASKNVERDILFAARDLIISLRSGMPLFNAITLVSKGYGDASVEFERIVDRVQLGLPLEQAIDDTIAQSKSESFRRIMLQASVSIKAGADVVQALQSIIDQVSQERIIEMRRYGQKLNAIAMFYMLFGVILPSMGVAVITILTTFIPLFPVTPTFLAGIVVFLMFMQIVFLKLITSSRPIFTL